MSGTRPASKLKHLTKGSRLPGKRVATFSWETLWNPWGADNGPSTEAPPSNGKAEISEGNAPTVPGEAVQAHFLRERDGDRGAVEDAVENSIPSGSLTNLIFSGDECAATSDNGAHPTVDSAGDARLPRWKRAADLGILMCLAWIWLPLVALLIAYVKAVSPGPAFYRQRRIGYRGKEFMIFKFRSMKVNAETRAHEKYVEELIANGSPMTKLDAADPRLIPGGRFFRATGLDELPQVLNVLRGEMSLVGPRPCTVSEFQRYQPEHRSRVDAPPGLTGLWQVSGKNRTTFNEMIAMDIFYARNMSLSLDLRIICKTIPAILRQTRDSAAAAPRSKEQAGTFSSALSSNNGRFNHLT